MIKNIILFLFIITSNIYANLNLINLSDNKDYTLKKKDFFITSIYYKGNNNLVDVHYSNIDKIYFNSEKKIHYVITRSLMNLPALDKKCGVYAEHYKMSIYKTYGNFLLKIYNYEGKYNGYEGDFYCEELHYLYKKYKNMIKLDNSINLSSSVILNSLKEFITSQYAKKHKLLFTFKDSSFNINTIKDILNEIPILHKTLTQYNNIAYYLEQAGAYKESIYLLEKIIEKYPNRTVAYINLGDSYLKSGNKEKAIENYKIYVKQMKEKNKEKKVPKRVLEIIDNSKISSKTINKQQNTSKIEVIKEEKTFFTKLLELFGSSTSTKRINIMQS
ncbi:M48 family metallopeptidase [Arcobacter sp. LA11]|uniref:tetratricopeptide repeat protein n=1 Tax=Arcobacter sp. LA11 TaxID=1898176 RepID=UPI00093222B8|nr:tetratricopeptide repeat protein [Arcobacter sp. LA11]